MMKTKGRSRAAIRRRARPATASAAAGITSIVFMPKSPCPHRRHLPFLRDEYVARQPALPRERGRYREKFLFLFERLVAFDFTQRLGSGCPCAMTPACNPRHVFRYVL